MKPALAACVGLAMFAACHPKFPTCREDTDCLDADNHGLQVHCIDGSCQECKSDADCGGGKSCQSMRCVAASSASSANAPGAMPPATPATGSAACSYPSIHFELNEADLSQADQQALQQVAQCLLAQANAHITVEGDCDERGTEEYNLALGQRRASNVEKYLEGLGVKRISTVSYGKDKPVCTQDTEACWRRNRRADFDVARK